MLGDGPGDRESIVGRGTSADLIEHCQRSAGGLIQNRSGFDHFDHESRLAAGDVIGKPRPGEYSVNNADSGLIGRNEAPDLRHQHQDGGLPDVSGFTGHVRSGDDHYLTLGIRKIDVIRDEPAGTKRRFDDRVATGLDLQK